MSLVRTIRGQHYLPLRAVPVITSGVLSADVLAAMISSPDDYCDADNGEVISPCRQKLDGSLLVVNAQMFKQLADAGPSTGLPHLYRGEKLPAGLLVALTAVREKYEIVVGVESRCPHVRTPPTVAFDLNPEVSASERAVLLEGLPPVRTNSAAALGNDITAAVDHLVTLCAQNGLAIDKACLPGNSKHLQKIVSRVVPRAGEVENSTFKDHCHRVGVGWRQGVEVDKLEQFLSIARTHHSDEPL